MSVGPSLVGKQILIDGVTRTVRHNPAGIVPGIQPGLKSVIIVLVSLVLNVLRIHPLKLEHLLYTHDTCKSKVQLLDIYTPSSSTSEEGFMIFNSGFI